MSKLTPPFPLSLAKSANNIDLSLSLSIEFLDESITLVNGRTEICKEERERERRREKEKKENIYHFETDHCTDYVGLGRLMGLDEHVVAEPIDDT